VERQSADKSAPADAVNAASEMLPLPLMPGLQSAAAGRAGAENSQGAAFPAAAVQGLQRRAGLNRISLQPPPVSWPHTLQEAMAATHSPAAPRRPADQVSERPPQRPLTGVNLATQPEPRPPTAAAAAEAESAIDGVHHTPTKPGSDIEGVVGETPFPLMTRSPRYEPGGGSRAPTQCP